MVERGLAESRERAALLIAEGAVLVGGAPAAKASRLVSPAEPVEVTGARPKFVGRGGEKLDGALARFALDVAGAAALDAGASTGGFTDCLLQHGAESVVSVDVGRGQLHERLRADDRVRSFERLDIRDATTERLGGAPFDVVVADLSFISLTRAVPALAVGLPRPGADLVLLVKPQFEAGRAEVSRGRGIVRDPATHREAVRAVCRTLGDAGAAIMGVMPSPITGQAGNVEFLVHAVAGAGAVAPSVVDGLATAAVDEAHTAGPGPG